MVASGDILLATHTVLRLDVTPVVADSSTWTTTETGILASVTGFLTTGQTYAVWFTGAVSASSAASPSAELSVMRIREDSAVGTQIQGINVPMPSSSSVGYPCFLYTEYTAVSTASKSFCLTGQRTGGAGNHQLRAGTARPAYMALALILS